MRRPPGDRPWAPPRSVDRPWMVPVRMDRSTAQSMHERSGDHWTVWSHDAPGAAPGDEYAVILFDRPDVPDTPVRGHVPWGAVAYYLAEILAEATASAGLPGDALTHLTGAIAHIRHEQLRSITEGEGT